MCHGALETIFIGLYINITKVSRFHFIIWNQEFHENLSGWNCSYWKIKRTPTKNIKIRKQDVSARMRGPCIGTERSCFLLILFYCKGYATVANTTDPERVVFVLVCYGCIVQEAALCVDFLTMGTELQVLLCLCPLPFYRLSQLSRTEL